MGRTLKIWNGRAFGIYSHLYICAYTNRQAIALVQEHYAKNFTASELNNYFSKGAWGKRMEAIYKDPKEPCLFAEVKLTKEIEQLCPKGRILSKSKKFKWMPNGEPDKFVIMKDDNWFAQIHLNGEMFLEEQHSEMIKIVTALNNG